MKVFIGSIIVLLLIGAGIWLMLSPMFNKVGETADKVKNRLKEEEHGETDTEKEK
ncbi:hypothetical protein RG959_05625 [Domibacillus sp. 8LH]|uniref:hypothetical protein n=1 Tax=Domibacillus TaxID=1433999 RepID=UPI001F585431|nr:MULTISPECIES: hypothetical protein [Domibacillus]MCI2253065.1 hypothetical protein [Domibacillus sp. PGB-M46]MCM3791237.1 hypothetical protein [Domibacillus indicus]